MMDLIATTTDTGLKIEAELDANAYPKRIQVTDEKLNRVRIQRAELHGG